MRSASAETPLPDKPISACQESTIDTQAIGEVASELAVRYCRESRWNDTIGPMTAGIAILACWVLLVLYWNLSARSVESAAEAQDFASRLARIPVWLGFVLFVAAWVHPFGPVAIRRTTLSNSIGVTICALGLFVAIWSRKALGAEWSRDVELKQGHKLVERGPYRFMRHPIYTGHLLMGVGTAIASGLVVAFVGLASFVAGFWIKLNQEERLLLRGFPDEYSAYKARVKALIPYMF
jgi:protein-S-isoprenylcysteine O-methyltransferase Ste14